MQVTDSAGADQESQCRALRQHSLSAHIASRRAARAPLPPHIASRRAARARFISISGVLPC